MTKVLLFLLALAAIYYWRKTLSRNEAPRDDARASQRTRQATPARAEAMQACAHCGVLVPHSEGVSTQQHFFCSPEHARLGPASHS
ncbi:MAG: PP0621 family protein [Rhodocyclaceae bacterium]